MNDKSDLKVHGEPSKRFGLQCTWFDTYPGGGIPANIPFGQGLIGD